MDSQIRQLAESDFLHKSALGVALVAIVIMAPFSINNFIQGRPFLGTGSLAIILILAFNAWSILRRDIYYPLITLLGLVPAILFFLNLSISKQGIVGILWCYVAIPSFYFILPEKKGWIANAALFILVIPKAWELFEPALAVRMMMTLLGVSMFSMIFVRVITDQQYKLQIQAMIDPLTGVFNRTILGESLKLSIQQNLRTKVPMTLVALDIDYFKKVNDTFGHDIGDKVLRDVGEILRKRCRSVDKVFRLGGEEFLVLLYGTDLENGRIFAEEIREKVEKNSFIPENIITVSIGVAALESDEDWRNWMKRSDQKLYEAKSAGRNRVII